MTDRNGEPGEGALGDTEHDPFDPPTTDLDLLEDEAIVDEAIVDEVDEAASAKPPPPPRSGLGRPSRPPPSPKLGGASRGTLRGVPSPKVPSPVGNRPGAGNTLRGAPAPQASPPKASVPPPPPPPGAGPSAGSEEAPTSKVASPVAAGAAPAPPRSPKKGRGKTKPRSIAPPPPPSVEESSPVDDSAAELAEHCQRALDASPSPERAARLHYELGRLHEKELDDAAKAAEHYQSALRHAPEMLAAIRGARRTLNALGRHAALLPLFDAEIALTREPDARGRLLLEKGRLLEDTLRQAGPALEVYREGLEVAPSSLPLLKATERALAKAKSWPALTEIYAKLAARVDDPSLKAAWLAAEARLIALHGSSPVEAASRYLAALDADPEASEALGALPRIAADAGQWSLVAEALRREQALVGDEETRAELAVALASLSERHLGDADGVVRHLEAALAIRPDEAAWLERLAKAHRDSGRAREEAKVLERLVGLVDAGRRGAALVRLGALYGEVLEDLDRARVVLERALEGQPSFEPAAEALFDLLARLGDHAAQAAALSAHAEALGDPKRAADLHHRVGSLVEAKLGRPEDAVKHHARALSLDADHRGAFDALCRLHAAAGRYGELAELYQRQVDRAPAKEIAIVWLFRLAAIREDRLDDPDGALGVYDRILALEPDHLGALHAAGRAAERAGRFERAVELSRAEAKRSPDAEHARALRLRAAELSDQRLDDASGAVSAMEAILAEAPDHRPTLDALSSLLRRLGHWDALTALLARRILRLPSAAEKAAMHTERARILDLHLGKKKEAAKAYRQALELDPKYEPARESLIEVLAALGEHAERATLLEAKVEASGGRAKARLAIELGVLYEDELGDRQKALDAYAKALEAQPGQSEALAARGRLLAKERSHRELAELLAERAEKAPDAILRKVAALEGAVLLSTHQAGSGPALDAVRPLFASDPDHLGGLVVVEEIYARAKDDAGLAATYEKLASSTSDVDAQRAALIELGRARVGLGESRAPVVRRLLALSPDDPQLLEAMAAEAEAAGDADAALAMHARLASTSTDASVGAHHQTQVGTLLLRAGDPNGALGAFRGARALDPKSFGAARGLTRAARAIGDAAALREAAEAEAAVTLDVALAVSLRLEAAKRRREAGADEEAALDLAEALKLDPNHVGAADALRATWMGLGRPERAIDALDAAAHASDRGERAASLHLAVAQLHAEVSGDVGAALAATDRAAKAMPSDPNVLARRAAYLERDGQWAEAADALERVLPRLEGEALIEAHLRLAHLAEERLDDPERAARSLRAVLARDEDRAEAIAPLVRIERLAGRDEEARRLAQRLIAVAEDAAQKGEAFAELAALELARGASAAAAAAAYSAIGVQGPTSAAAGIYRELIGGGVEAAGWDTYAAALMTYLEAAKADGASLTASYLELARVFGEGQNRPDKAIATLREGLEAEPGAIELVLDLTRRYGGLKAHDKGLALIREQLARDTSDPRVYRAAADAMRGLGEIGGAAIALAPLVALGAASEEEAKLVRGRQPRAAEAPAQILNEAGLRRLAEPGTFESPALGLLQALADPLIKMEGRDLESLGLSRRDRLRAGDTHPTRAFVDRVARVFGTSELDLYLVSDGPTARFEASSPPALLVPARLESVPDPELAFHLARPLALHSRGVAGIDRLEPALVAAILAGAARSFDPSFEAPGIPEQEIEEQAARVGRAVSILNKGRIRDAALSFAADPPSDLGAWAEALRDVAHRAALLVADDLLAAFTALGIRPGSDPRADDLIRTWLGEPALRFRRAVNQQI